MLNVVAAEVPMLQRDDGQPALPCTCNCKDPLVLHHTGWLHIFAGHVLLPASGPVKRLQVGSL